MTGGAASVLLASSILLPWRPPIGSARGFSAHTALAASVDAHLGVLTMCLNTASVWRTRHVHSLKLYRCNDVGVREEVQPLRGPAEQLSPHTAVAEVAVEAQSFLRGRGRVIISTEAKRVSPACGRSATREPCPNYIDLRGGVERHERCLPSAWRISLQHRGHWWRISAGGKRACNVGWMEARGRAAVLRDETREAQPAACSNRSGCRARCKVTSISAANCVFRSVMGSVQRIYGEGKKSAELRQPPRPGGTAFCRGNITGQPLVLFWGTAGGRPSVLFAIVAAASDGTGLFQAGNACFGDSGWRHDDR